MMLNFGMMLTVVEWREYNTGEDGEASQLLTCSLDDPVSLRPTIMRVVHNKKRDLPVGLSLGFSPSYCAVPE